MPRKWERLTNNRSVRWMRQWFDPLQEWVQNGNQPFTLVREQGKKGYTSACTIFFYFTEWSLCSVRQLWPFSVSSSRFPVLKSWANSNVSFESSRQYSSNLQFSLQEYQIVKTFSTLLFTSNCMPSHVLSWSLPWWAKFSLTKRELRSLYDIHTNLKSPEFPDSTGHWWVCK